MCEKVLKATQKLPNICVPCSESIYSLPVATCPICGKPKDVGYDRVYCMYCAKKIEGVTAIVSAFPYEKEIRKSILKFKFYNRPYFARSFGFILAERLKAYHLENAFEAIIPVPLSKKRQKERGYNQAKLIGKALSKNLNIPMLDCLEKIKERPSQSSLPLEKRKSNLKDAYKIKDKAFKENASPLKSVLLIDDIYTTGATIRACAKELHKAGIRKVYGATIALRSPWIEIEEDG